MPRDSMSSAAGKVVPLRPSLISRRRDEREFLPAALEIIETPPSPVGMAIGAAIIGFAVFATLWAILGHVDIVATAEGRVLPTGKTKTIQPLEIGVVKAIHVTDGDHVTAGEVLVELDPTEASADQLRESRDLRQARLDLARMKALEWSLTNGTAPIFQPPQGADAQEILSTREAMEAQWAEQKAKIAALDQQFAEKRAEAEEAAASIAKLSDSLPIVAQEEEIRHRLKDMQFGNKLAWLEARQRLTDQTHDIQVMTHHRQEALASSLALEEQMHATQAEFSKNLRQDLEKTETEVNQLGSELAKSDNKLIFETLRAPIPGTIQQLAIHTIGGVVTPAEALMAIVPDNPGLTIEASVKNDDVGFVHAGQRVAIKVAAFNFTRYGLVEGRVLGVSRDVAGPDPSASKSESDHGDASPRERQDSLAYVAHIELARDSIMTENGLVPIGPGMQVTAEIKTGRRRIIDYLLSPLARAGSEAGHER